MLRAGDARIPQHGPGAALRTRPAPEARPRNPPARLCRPGGPAPARVRHGRFAVTVLAVGLIMAPAAPAAAVAAPAGGLRLVERPAAGVAALAASGPSSATAVRPAAGDRLLIAAIAVDARIEPVGVDPAGNMATPSSPQTVAWYRFGPRPGAVGDAVLAGHL